MDYIQADRTSISVMFHLNTGGLAVTGFKIGYVRWTVGVGTSFAETGPTALTALATITTAHADNQGIYLDTDTSGGSYFLFRADFPDAAFATGADEVICHLYDDGNNVIGQRIFSLVRQPVNVEKVEGEAVDIATETKQDLMQTDVSAILVDTGTTLDGKLNTAQADLDIITGADGVNLLTATQASIDAIEVDTGTTIPGILGTPADTDMSTDIANVKAKADAIVTDTEDIQTQIGTAGAGLTDLGGMSTGMKAEVNAEMVDVLGVDTMDELPASTDLPTNPTIKEALMADYMMKSCKITQTATEQKHHNKAGTNTFRKAVSDDGTTATYGISAAGA